MTDTYAPAVGPDDVDHAAAAPSDQPPPVVTPVTFTVERDPFKRALALLAQTVDSGSSLPVLGMVRMDVDGTRYTIAGTNMVTAAQIDGVCESDGATSLLLPHAQLEKLVKGFSSDTITFAYAPGAVLVGIEAGAYQGELNTLNPADFPTIVSEFDTNPVTLPAAWVGAIQKGVAFSAHDTQHNLKCVRVTLAADKGVEAVALDGYQLALMQRAVQHAGDPVQLKILAECFKLLSSAVQLGFFGPTVEIGQNEAHNVVVFQGLGAVLTARLSDTLFPDVWRFIPAQDARSQSWGFSLPIEELVKAVRLGKVMVDKDGIVRLTIVDNGMLGTVLRVATKDLNGRGRSTVDIPLDAVDGPSITADTKIALSIKKLEAALAACPADVARFEFMSQNSPLCLYVDTDGDDGAAEEWLGLIMPQRLNAW